MSVKIVEEMHKRYKIDVNLAITDTVQGLSYDLGIPPAYSTIQATIFLLNQIDLYCKDSEIPTPEFVKLALKSAPNDLTGLLDDVIKSQFLNANTEGDC